MTKTNIPLVERFFTANEHDPFKAVNWVKRDAIIKDATGQVFFEQKDVEFPESWSQQAVNIVASKYFKGPLGTPRRENSVKQLISRVVSEITEFGEANRYFVSESTTADSARIFRDELTYLLVNQMAAFNSPVWFNVGVRDEPSSGYCWDTGKLQDVFPVRKNQHKPQPSACFIVAPEDNMGSILDWVKTEGMIFKGGSGSGANVSKIRSSREMLSSGGRPSGPLPFMQINDSAAGSIKSGGKHRRAAKMVELNSRHPDIFEFVRSKANEEAKIRRLVEAGWKNDYNDPNGAQAAAFFQNENHSVSADDQFMQAVLNDAIYSTLAVVDGRVIDKFPARSLMDAIAEATWACGDPGMQFRDTMNKWNVVKGTAPIRGTNPCCFRGDTLVDTSEGRIRIDALVDMQTREEVLPYAFAWGADNLPVLRPILNTWKAGETNRMVEVETDKGIRLVCTPDHRFLTFSGEYVPALELKAGTRLRKIGRGVNDDRSGRRYIRHRETETVPNGCRYQSRFVWEQINGPVPDGFEVHHKNEDPTDDRGSNLELQKAQEHHFLHSKGVANARFIEGNLDRFVAVYDAILSTDKATHKTNGDVVTLSRWNKYIQKNGLTGIVPLGRFKQGIATIQGKTWNDFVAWIEEQRSSVNDRVKSVTYIDSDCLVPVYDLEVDGVHNFAVTNNQDNGQHTIVVHNSEFVFIDDTSCNLASLNLMKFRTEDGVLDVAGFLHAVHVLIIAQDILVDLGSYPTEAICRNSHNLRPLGLGYANLGAYLMSLGYPYNSDLGRTVASEITALMTGQAYLTSAHLARRLGSFALAGENINSIADVLSKHKQAVCQLRRSPMQEKAEAIWKMVYEQAVLDGDWLRNAQVTVLAPTGTIGFMMDCDTTGIEPELNLIKYKYLVGGGTMKIVNQTVSEALVKLGYNPVISQLLSYIEQHGTLEGCPDFNTAHLEVFDCALPSGRSGRSIHYAGHIRMMAAVQPFLSGAISKTVNMPNSATPKDIAEAYMLAWKLGLKAIAIYRDGSKNVQPLATKKDGEAKVATVENVKDVYSEGLAVGIDIGKKMASTEATRKPSRRKMPATRNALCHKFNIAGHQGYLHVGMYEDGAPGEIFINMNKEGSTMAGVMGNLALIFSMALQYGVPLEKMVEKLSHVKYEPSGITQDPDIRFADSIMDYVARWLEKEFLKPRLPCAEDTDTKQVKPEVSNATLQAAASDLAAVSVTSGKLVGTVHDEVLVQVPSNASADAPFCTACGALMTRNGSCFRCGACGGTSGCS